MMRKNTSFIVSVAAMALIGSAMALTAFAQSPNAEQGAAGLHGRGRGGRPQGVGMRQHGEGVFGTVTAISGTTITVEKKGFGKNAATPPVTTYVVDASTATIDKNGVAATLASVAVGDMISVTGTVSGTAVTAKTIHDGRPAIGKGNREMQDDASGTNTPGANMPTAPLIAGNGQPVVMGSVTTISGNTLDITNKAGASYSIDASGAKITKSGKDAAIADVAVTDVVLVQGAINGTSVTASSVIDQTFAHPTVAADGSMIPQSQKHAGFFGGMRDFFSHLFGF